MDFQEIAKRIASSEDPYIEFSKQAEDLDDIKKTTLAREVNRILFLQRLENKDGDGDIRFDVVEPPIKGTHQTTNVSNDVVDDVEKTASDNQTKAHLVDDSMFVLMREVNRDRYISVNNGALEKVAEETMVDNYNEKKDDYERRLSIEKSRAIGELNDIRASEIEKIANEVYDASEVRDVIAMFIENGLPESIVSDFIAAAKPTAMEIEKVATVKVENEKERVVRDAISKIKDAIDAKGFIENSRDISAVRKVLKEIY